MKKHSISLLFLCLAIVLLCTHVSAQDYVVTAKGDTLRGEIKSVQFGLNSKVQLSDSTKKKTSYTMFQVRAFFYKKEIYQPVKSAEGYKFMKQKKAGYLSLYSFQQPNQITFDGLFLTKMDGTGIEVPNLSFKKIMTGFLKDCDSVTIKIESGELTKRHLDKIIDEYNDCVKQRTVERQKSISVKADQSKKISAWDTLLEKINAHPDFEGNANAIEMVTEIKSKISKEEKIPNFLLDGLKSIINPTELKPDLDRALLELN